MAKVFKGKTYKGETRSTRGTNISGSKIKNAIVYSTNSTKRKNRQLSDKARVIRKRFEDEAKRYERRADKLGITAEARYLNQAAIAARRKAEEYKMANLRKRFGKGDSGNLKIDEYLDTVGQKESKTAMASFLKSNVEREEQLARRVLSTRAGSRFYAGTVSIWRGKVGEARNEAIKEFFGKESIWQVLQHFSDVLGIDFFDTAEQQRVVHSTSPEAQQIMKYVVKLQTGKVSL